MMLPMEIAMTANELLPCPFCGGEAELTSRDGETPWDEIGVIYCPDCNSKYENTMDLFDPASTWNRRAPLTRAALAASPLVQEIVAEAVKAEREACAQVADDLALDLWREYKDLMSIYCASTHHEGMSDGASDVAASIRARGEG